MGVALAYPTSFFDRHGWALWFIPASAHSTIVNLFWRVRAGITKLHRWWMAFWSSHGYLRENWFIFYGSMVWAILPKEVGGGRLGISVYTYLCFRYKHSLPGSPGWRFGYKTDEAREEEIINYPRFNLNVPIVYC